VAKLDGRVVGCAGLDLINPKVAVFTYLAVEELLRHHGIGSALIEKRFAEATRRGATTIALCTMHYFYNFYKRRGFRTIHRAKLPDDIRSYSQFTAKCYMKCAVMINEHFARA
jgi:N-acetylglutamate synthase-like GNAT family acetyltransferase